MFVPLCGCYNARLRTYSINCVTSNCKSSLSNERKGCHARSVFRCFKEIIVVVWLATELGLRVWSSGCRSRYQTKMGRLRFMRKPFCVLGQSLEHRTRGDGHRFSSLI